MTTPNDVVPTDNEDADPIPNVRQPAFALESILAEQPELYINLVGQPTIVLAETTLSASPDRPQSRTWPLRSRAAGIDTKDRLWPKAASQLSRRIAELKPVKPG